MLELGLQDLTAAEMITRKSLIQHQGSPSLFLPTDLCYPHLPPRDPWDVHLLKHKLSNKVSFREVTKVLISVVHLTPKNLRLSLFSLSRLPAHGFFLNWRLQVGSEIALSFFIVCIATFLHNLVLKRWGRAQWDPPIHCAPSYKVNQGYLLLYVLLKTQCVFTTLTGNADAKAHIKYKCCPWKHNAHVHTPYTPT